MDHSPGQRQFANIEKYREYYQGKYSLNDAEMARYEEEQLQLAATVVAAESPLHCRDVPG